MARELKFTITLTPRTALYLLAAGVMISAVLELGSETMTMTATYPSPVGIYRTLITTGGTAGNPGNTLFARDAGNVGIGTSSPGAKLDVKGNVNVTGNITAGGSGAGDISGNSAAIGSGGMTVNGPFQVKTSGTPQPGYVLKANDNTGTAVWAPLSSTGNRVFYAKNSAPTTVGSTNSTIASITITPTSANSKFLILASAVLGNGDQAGDTMAGIYNGSTLLLKIASLDAGYWDALANAGSYVDAPGTTSPVTYSLQAWADGGTGYVNRCEGGPGYSGTSSLTIIEFN